MDERELIEIENRLESYPAHARNDVLRLTSELRRLGGAKSPAPAHAAAHLYDPLTGVLNGGAYGVRFAMARARATRFRKMFAVMSVEVALTDASEAVADADRDLVIKHVAERLEASVRATDTLARIGGQNFAVILEDLSHAEHAERVKQLVIDALAAPLRIAGREVAPQIRVQMDFHPSPRQSGVSPSAYN